MEGFWTWAVQLPSRTLRTVTGQVFDVTAADRQRGVTVVPKSSNKARTVRPVEFERTLALGLRGADLAPIRVRQSRASEANPAYVVAIVRAFQAETGA
jgi:hypothetical protein